jgi:hypothetical protein
MTPGGDFAWIKKNYQFVLRGSTVNNSGDSHGHNIVAADYGYTADHTHTGNVSPGGNYPVDSLACSSCHDPHGKYRRFADGTYATTGLPIFNSGSYNTSADPISGVAAVGVYRLLGGVGYQPKSLADQGGSYQFVNPSPEAVAPSTYNRSEATTQTHVAYRQGMSEWCANCHGAMLENNYASGTAGHRHPAGSSAKFTAAIAANYNSYVSSGILTNTDPTKAYSTLAPFELGSGKTWAQLKALAVNTDDQDQSASTSANVMCLSCHRAHASGFAEGTRFMLENEFMTTNTSGVAAYDATTTNGGSGINQGLSVAEQQAAYYGRPATFFGPNARNYCNKCHAKD